MRTFSGLFSIWTVVFRLSNTNYAAYCDACLRGSEVIIFDAPNIARFWAIERLRGGGWKHIPPEDLDTRARQECERMWSGATYCIDCASTHLISGVRRKWA